jgi:hypothetical protein
MTLTHSQYAGQRFRVRFVEMTQPVRFVWQWRPGAVDPNVDYSRERGQRLRSPCGNTDPGRGSAPRKPISKKSLWHGARRFTPITVRGGRLCSAGYRSMSKRRVEPGFTETLPDAALLFAALGDETRLALVAQLSEKGPASISTLAQDFLVSRQAVTKHLQVPRDCRHYRRKAGGPRTRVGAQAGAVGRRAALSRGDRAGMGGYVGPPEGTRRKRPRE